MNARRAARTTAAILGLVSTIAACGSSNSTASSGSSSSSNLPTGTVSVGCLSSQTGTFSTLGLSTCGGLQLGVNDINAKGGFVVGGTKYTLKYTSADSASAPASTTAAVTQLVRDQGVKFLFGPEEAADAAAAQAGIGSLGGMWLTFAASLGDKLDNDKAQGPNEKYVFTTSASSSQLTKWLIDASLQNNPSLKSAVILTGNAASLDIYANTAVSEYQAKGVTVPAANNIRFDVASTTDFSPILTKIKSIHPDAVVLLGIVAGSINTILKQWTGLGDVAGSVWVLGASAPTAQKDAIGGPLSFPFGYVSQGSSDISQPSAALTNLISEYKQQLGKDPVASTAIDLPTYYTGVEALVQAMKDAGTVTDLDKISAALLKVKANGPNWPLSFDQYHAAQNAATACVVTAGQVSCKTLSSGG